LASVDPALATKSYTNPAAYVASASPFTRLDELLRLDSLGRRFAPDPTAIPDITVELVPLHLYDELGTVRAGRR
jgi:hypothetical protein